MKPTLPPELEKQFDHEVSPYLTARMNGLTSGKVRDIEKVKQFLAQALADQREQIYTDIKINTYSWIGEDGNTDLIEYLESVAPSRIKEMR